jgi:hypothetical protein
MSANAPDTVSALDAAEDVAIGFSAVTDVEHVDFVASYRVDNAVVTNANRPEAFQRTAQRLSVCCWSRGSTFLQCRPDTRPHMCRKTRQIVGLYRWVVDQA